MSDLRVLEKKQWATPEEVQSTIDAIVKDSREERWISIAVVAEDESGQVHTFSSRTENKFSVAAQFMLMAVRLLGFVEKS